MQAIKIGPLNGATYSGREKQIGPIEANKQADLVLINGAPKKDIQHMRRMEIVFKNGVGFKSVKPFESVKGKIGPNQTRGIGSLSKKL